MCPPMARPWARSCWPENTVMAGYFRDAEATENAFRGGVLPFRRPRRDAPRWARIEIRDRAKDIIITGGENVSSLEVERVLQSPPRCCCWPPVVAAPACEMGRDALGLRRGTGSSGLDEARAGRSSAAPTWPASSARAASSSGPLAPNGHGPRLQKFVLRRTAQEMGDRHRGAIRMSGTGTIDAQALAGWLAAHLPGRGLPALQRIGGGSRTRHGSSIGATRASCCARSPRARSCPAPNAVEREFRVLRALQDTDVPRTPRAGGSRKTRPSSARPST